jgi:hypothetical protein
MERVRSLILTLVIDSYLRHFPKLQDANLACAHSVAAAVITESLATAVPPQMIRTSFAFRQVSRSPACEGQCWSVAFFPPTPPTSFLA